MNVYYLVQNLMYASTHIVKHRWYHDVFGEPKIMVDQVYASSKEHAEFLFREKGRSVGFYGRI